MKKSYVLYLAVVSSVLTIQAVKADVIADWNFETFHSTNAIFGQSQTDTGVMADIGTGTASGFHQIPATTWSTAAGNGSGQSWAANFWNQNDYWEFAVSTVNYSAI